MRNKPKRECGSCRHWVKIKNERFGRGLCTLLDVMSKAQQGKKCKHWKGIKYKRSYYYFELTMDDELPNNDGQDLTDKYMQELGLIDENKNVTEKGMQLMSLLPAYLSGIDKREIYLSSIKVGDTVYPAYDGKGGRVTPCKVISVNGDTIMVSGVFWGQDSDESPVEGTFVNGEGWVKYGEELTLMEMMGVTEEDEEGDFYELKNPEVLKFLYQGTEYLTSIGLR